MLLLACLLCTHCCSPYTGVFTICRPTFSIHIPFWAQRMLPTSDRLPYRCGVVFFSVQLFSPHCFCIRSSRRIYGWLAPLGEQSPASRNTAHVKAQTLWKLWFDPDSWHMVSGHLWFCDFLNESLRKVLSSKKNNLYHHLQLCAQMYNNAGQFRYPY